MGNGYIKLYRKFKDWEWFNEPGMVVIFIYFLLQANYAEKEWRGVKINKGQLITSKPKISKNTGLSIQNIKTCIQRLKSTDEITVKTTAKYSIITIVNYNKYQMYEIEPTAKPTAKPTANQPPTNRQPTTTNKYNNKYNNNISIDSNNTIDYRKELLYATEHGSEDINSLFKEFEPINPTINYGNKTQRKALQEMLKKFGREKLTNTIRYAVSIHGQPYSPTITTPHQLKEKMGELLSYYKKEANKSNKFGFVSI